MNDLNAFAEQLAQELRSKQSLDLPTDPTEETGNVVIGRVSSDDLLLDAEERAAVSGRFSPTDLTDFIGDEAVRQQTLSQLASVCTVETVDGKLQWLLTQNSRKETLQRLASSNQLTTVLNQPLPETDAFGDMLRAILKEGPDLSLEDRSRADLLAIRAATEALNDTGLPQPNSAQIRQFLLKDTLLADYEILLNNHFVGRQHELKQLNQFVRQDNSPTSYQAWTGMAITGTGGVGKSTLLAKFSQDAVDQHIATLVLLDFDRPGINPKDTFWLEMEITRQVGLQYPDVSEDLRKLRADSRQQRQDGTSLSNTYSPHTEGLEVSRGLRSVMSDMSRLIREGNPTQPPLPILFVLDTFEEVMQQEEATGRVLDWLSEIGNALYPITLRVIFSGRLFGQDREELTSWGVTNFIELTELDRRQAEQLLRNLNVAKPMAKRLAYSDLFPRRPLELRLLAKIATRESEKSIDELESEIRRGGPAAKDLFTGIVYKRVLQRINDKDEVIREIAYPGLVLRYVTPALIEQVLVPTLNLQLTTSPEQVLDRLASYEWLASRQATDDPQEVWHRSDLRRSVLQLILAQEPDKARRISEMAIQFFAGKTEKEWAEGMYHRLLLMRSHQDGETFELVELKRAAQYIKGDAVDLPKPAAVLLRFATDGRIQSTDVDCLPNRYLAGAYHKTGRRLVNNQEYNKAYQLVKRGQEAGIAYKLPANKRPDHWEIDTLFTVATWNELPEALAQTETTLTDASLLSFANWLYPAILVNPDLRSSDQLIRRLTEATRSGTVPDGELTGPDAILLVSYLSSGMVLQNARVPFLFDTRSGVDAIVRLVQQQPAILNSARLMRKLTLLRFLSNQPAETFSMAPSTLRIQPGWMQRLIESQPILTEGDTAPALFQEASNALFSGLQGKQPTVRRLLRIIDGLYKDREHWQQVQFRFKDFKSADDCLALFRGPDSEFRHPCRYALLEAYPDTESRRQLGALLKSVIGLDLVDLAPDAFAESLAPDPEHGLESYVELADRTWQLGELLRRTATERPQAPKLQLVLAAYERWDKAFTDTMRSFFADPKQV